jgi:hypothetical protein
MATSKAKEKVVGGGEGDPIDLTQRVTVIAPRAKDGQTLYHTEGEETTISIHQLEHFKKLGYKEKK